MFYHQSNATPQQIVPNHTPPSQTQSDVFSQFETQHKSFDPQKPPIPPPPYHRLFSDPFTTPFSQQQIHLPPQIHAIFSQQQQQQQAVARRAQQQQTQQLSQQSYEKSKSQQNYQQTVNQGDTITNVQVEGLGVGVGVGATGIGVGMTGGKGRGRGGKGGRPKKNKSEQSAGQGSTKTYKKGFQPDQKQQQEQQEIVDLRECVSVYQREQEENHLWLRDSFKRFKKGEQELQDASINKYEETKRLLKEIVDTDTTCGVLVVSLELQIRIQ
eukprot:TRINITY_DN14434_c0_g1_i8.p1 TRINITY_DN14434_c0_g1~~TRINITY_DN14434_c0_g1_i8.p1  ORF type:complete len:282 (+),score=39.42 TRINITY_DN14434_c0_g1_i8:37-846(+)